jgi:26S proteasome regulatory subunit N5
LKSTTRLCKAIAEHCYNTKDFVQLNASVALLSKKHGQLKGAIQAMVELVMSWLEDVKKAHGTERWLGLLETLRDVTEGKVRDCP